MLVRDKCRHRHNPDYGLGIVVEIIGGDEVISKTYVVEWENGATTQERLLNLRRVRV